MRLTGNDIGKVVKLDKEATVWCYDINMLVIFPRDIYVVITSVNDTKGILQGTVARKRMVDYTIGVEISFGENQIDEYAKVYKNLYEFNEDKNIKW